MIKLKLSDIVEIPIDSFLLQSALRAIKSTSFTTLIISQFQA